MIETQLASSAVDVQKYVLYVEAGLRKFHE